MTTINNHNNDNDQRQTATTLYKSWANLTVKSLNMQAGSQSRLKS